MSLHAARPELRDVLVPLNRRYPLHDVVRAATAYADVTGRRVTYEMVMIDGINDTAIDARATAALLRDRLAHVNLIPMNPVAHTPWRPSPPERVEAFAAVLRAAGLDTTVRRNRGLDIGAACGQLAAEHAGRPAPTAVQRRRELIERRSAEALGNGAASGDWAGRPTRPAVTARLPASSRRSGTAAVHGAGMSSKPAAPGHAPHGVLISASILNADFSRLDRVAHKMERAGVDRLHLDVMDGHFVPNLTFGPDVVAAWRRVTDLPLDVHLMIDEPSRYIDRFIAAGPQTITFHVEAPETDEQKDAALAAIRAAGQGAGLAVSPRTPVAGRGGPHRRPGRHHDPDRRAGLGWPGLHVGDRPQDRRGSRAPGGRRSGRSRPCRRRHQPQDG